MKAVIIGESGHFEYALESENKHLIVAFAPASVHEDLTYLRKSAPHLKAYDCYQRMLEIEKPSIAIINPEFYLNTVIILDCLKKGIHCFAEKPVALNLSELAMIKEENSAYLASMMIHRYEPWFYATYLAFQSGAIGQLVAINAQKSYKMGEKPLWMHHKKYFGGIIPWVGTHAIDWLHWFSKGKIDLLWSYQKSFGNNNQGEVESNASLGFEVDNALATIVLDYKRPNMSSTHGDDRLRLVGEYGIIEIQDSKAFITSNHKEKQELKQNVGPNIFDDFVAYINGEKSMRLSKKDILEVTRLTILAEQMAFENGMNI